MLAGQDRNRTPHGTATLRTAQRGMRLAADLRLPLVTIIDTPGGELSPGAEEDGIAREIARSLVTLISRLVRRRNRGPIAAEASPHQLLRDLGRALQAELQSLGAQNDETRLAGRYRKYRHLGLPRS